MKTVVTATDPETGTTYSITTVRTVTHVVIVVDQRDQRDGGTVGDRWVEWCGSERNAAKSASAWNSRRGVCRLGRGTTNYGAGFRSYTVAVNPS